MILGKWSSVFTWRTVWERVPHRVIVNALVITVFITGGLFVVLSCFSGESESLPSETLTSINVTPPREFPSYVYNSDQVLQAYEAAVRMPEVLQIIPCYCGCGEAHGHQNLKDCFFKADGSFNDHGAFCEICDMEVADIAQWRAEGYSLEQIRGLIDEKYPRYGEPTDTAPIVQSEAPAKSELKTAFFTDGPRISFDEDSVDIGKVPVDIPINFVFRFTNVGNAPLDIINVWVKALRGCCPPIPVIGPRTLQPGEESTILIGETARNSAGLHEFEITVESNDPVEPEKKLYLAVNFKEDEPEIDASPPPGNQDAGQ